MGDILVIGFISIDFIGHVEGFPVVGPPTQATDLDLACGSRAANQAMALAALEVPSALLARIGDDHHAEVLRDELVELGVDDALLLEAPAATGIRLISERPDGEQQIVTFRGANDYLSVDDCNRRLDAFSSASAVAVTTEPAGAVAVRALELARQVGVPGVLTHAAGTQHISDRALAAADVVVVSDSTAHGLLDPDIARNQPEAAARALCQRGAPAVVLLTAGRAILAQPETLHEVASPARLDSEDAVDAAVAGIVHGLSMGEKLGDAVMRGVRTGNLLVD
jgi:ribokinase